MNIYGGFATAANFVFLSLLSFILVQINMISVQQ